MTIGDSAAVSGGYQGGSARPRSTTAESQPLVPPRGADSRRSGVKNSETAPVQRPVPPSADTPAGEPEAESEDEAA